MYFSRPCVTACCAGKQRPGWWAAIRRLQGDAGRAGYQAAPARRSPRIARGPMRHWPSAAFVGALPALKRVLEGAVPSAMRHGGQTWRRRRPSSVASSSIAVGGAKTYLSTVSAQPKKPSISLTHFSSASSPYLAVHCKRGEVYKACKSRGGACGFQ